MLSQRRIPVINTIPIVSAAALFTYTFNLPTNNTVQLLWAQFTQVNAAGGLVRVPVMQIVDELANVIYQITYFTTVAPGGTLLLSWNQGNTIVPPTVLGRNTSLPTDGIFVRNNWTLSFFSLNSAVADVFTGYFQTRGLHNSAAP